ncbi:hypothetical protein M407DRAFT_77868, partial [Tulasnella calospora MUT 4182]
VNAPMDFAIGTSWQVRYHESYFPAGVDDDLLKPVHLSNGFEMVPNTCPLTAGDVCTSKPRAVSIINVDSGKSVKVKWPCIADGQPTIETTYPSFDTDPTQHLRIVDTVPYAVDINSFADIAVLEDKEWCN